MRPYTGSKALRRIRVLKIYMKIALGLLTNRDFKKETVISLLNLNGEFNVISAFKGYTIAENRNYLAVQAVKGEYDYLLMIDDDMVFPPDTLEKLLSYNKDIIGVDSHPKGSDNKTYEPLGEDGECSKVGTGIILIKTEVFKNTPRPWFNFNTSELGNTINGEDWMFCLKAREAGFKVFVDTTLEIGHVGSIIFKF